MELRLTHELIEAIGLRDLLPYGINKDNMRWNSGTEINLARYSRAKLLDLRNLIEPFAQVGSVTKGAGFAHRDIGIWLNALKDAGGAKPKTVQNFYAMLKQYLLKHCPGQRVYHWDTEKNCWWAYFVGKVEYHPRYVDRGTVYPAHCNVKTYYWEFGVMEAEEVSYYEDDIKNIPISEGFAHHGYVIETEELRAIYRVTIDRYNAHVMNVGEQFWARGTATDDLDGNKPKNDNYWYSSRTNTIRLDKNGEASRVVMDLFREEDKETNRNNRHREETLEERFWYYEGRKRIKANGDEEDDEEAELGDDLEETFVKPEVPVHPTCAVFDLRRHLRLRAHIDQLTEYVYDTDLGDKLVLPEDERALVALLCGDHTAFSDIIAGKGGGAIVLCVGKPGLGKTLTAEVYAEVTRRPLFSVQCSQLGTKQDKLEDELLKSFARAERWNAILLLDEADVYVAPRGSDLVQNAIVGVFLRTMEYFKGVMFMTTNRVDLVDDAIASRCIAKLSYDVPTIENQKLIWRILADNARLDLPPLHLNAIVKTFPYLSGRDIKNLLKLGALVGESRQEKKITLELITFVKRFKPTLDLAEATT